MINPLNPRRRHAAPAPESIDPLAEALVAEAAALTAQADAERRTFIAEASVAEAEAKAKRDAIEHRARLHEEERERAAQAKRTRDAEAARVAQVAARRIKRRDRGDNFRTMIAEHSSRARRLGVNLIVNGAAGFGQFRFYSEQMNLPLFAAVALAAGLELIGVTVLDYGLAARREGRPAQLKFIAAAALAGVVAYLNYAHWSVTPGQQALAIPFAILSLLNPPLWAWYAAERARVLQVVAPAPNGHKISTSLNKINASDNNPPQDHDKAIAGFGVLQWLMWLPETFAAKRQAVRHKIADPEVAYRVAREHLDHKIKTRDDNRAQREIARAARQAEKEAAALAKQAAALAAKQPKELPAPPKRYLPDPEDGARMSDKDKRDGARDAYRAARLDGADLLASDIADAYDMSISWARLRIKDVREPLQGEVQHDDDEDNVEDNHNRSEISE